jgi:hypothetical protein
MRLIATSIVGTLVFVLVVGLGLVWAQSAPAPAAVSAATPKTLTPQQVQLATTISVQAAQIQRDVSAARRELETAAVNLAAVLARQQALNQQVTATAPVFVAALGGVVGVDTFDFNALALRAKPGKDSTAVEGDGPPRLSKPAPPKD